MFGLVAPCAMCGLHHSSNVVCPISQLLVGDARPTLASGMVVARRYQIIEILHRGSMSTVYRATDAGRCQQRVILKELNLHALPPAESAEAFNWFLREAHLLSTIRHRALPRLHTSFSEGARHYLVMEEIPGLSLEMRSRQGALPEDQVFRWDIELCDVLHFLHSQREPIVYRDLKPSNVLEHAQTGRLVLVDFGVARRATPGQVGTAVGTPGYAAPEQYQGFADARSDLYALGATLHRLLTGYDAEQERPFRQPPVLGLRPTVTGATAAIVDRALSLEPARRYRSARVMRDAVRKALKQTPDRRYAATAPLYLWTSVQPLIVVPISVLFLLNVALPLHLGVWAWPAFLLCLYAPTLLYRIPLRELRRYSQGSTDRAILLAARDARSHFFHRAMVGVGFWLFVSLAAHGITIAGIPLFFLTILAILMWRVGVGRAAIGVRSRHRLRRQQERASSQDQLSPGTIHV